ncbi:probable alpha,alpha-trehalose-phosphate synthase [UDP-forming] 7 [Tanacetum coccineum]
MSKSYSTNLVDLQTGNLGNKRSREILSSDFSKDCSVSSSSTSSADASRLIIDHVSATLLENFNCVPVFLTPELSSNHYDGFCKQFLWPIFHDKLPLLNTEDGQYDPDLWDAYTLVNKEFFKKVTEVKQLDGKTVLLSVDDLDIFKGVNLKILAMGKLLESHPTWQGKAVLVQILNPARGRGLYVAEIKYEIGVNSQKINTKFES